MKCLTILGSTGSIGTKTLKIIKKHPNKFLIQALVANSNVTVMTEQCLDVHPQFACLIDSQAAKKLKKNLDIIGGKTKVLSGIKSACELSTLDNINTVVSAIIGIAGALPTLSALRAGKQVLLANKESLVTCGKLLIKEINKKKSNLIPIDSEHNAIFQNLPKKFQENIGNASLNEYGISKIILTASGGACRNVPLPQLSEVTPEKVCIHPVWNMGKKISVDSATMMNKGLEYIEASLLFNASSKQIEILVHPESIVHSMINYNDGTIIAQLSPADMIIPITYALSYPKRISTNIQHLSFSNIKKLNFDIVDNKRYPCLKLAIQAYNAGQEKIIILNAANEIAVDAFLSKKIPFTSIPIIIERALNQTIDSTQLNNIEDIFFIDQQTRSKTIKIINKYYK